MKRMIALILLLFTLVNFAACGNISVGSDSQYKHDMLKERLYNVASNWGHPYLCFKGGTMILSTPEVVKGQEVPMNNSGKEWYVYIFDETTKVLYMPCFNASCTHDSSECFSWKLFCYFGYSYVNVCEDCVILIKNIKNNLIAYFYSFDGTLNSKYEFDMSQLKNSDGSDAVNPCVDYSVASYGNKVYVSVRGYDYVGGLDEGEGKEDYNRWLMEFDLESKEFQLIANYVVPDNYSTHSDYFSIDKDKVIWLYDNRVFYTFDLSTGEYEVDTEEIPDSSQYARAFAQFTCGDDYYILSSRKEGKLNYRIVTEREETLIVSETFGNGAYVLGDLFAESENGLIYNYYENGKTADDDIYTVNENGRDVVYVKPKRLVYVEKADLADGTVDEPLFYDAELGMFK